MKRHIRKSVHISRARRLSLAVLLVCLVAPQSRGQEPDVCNFVTSVLAEAPTDFAKFKGPSDPNSPGGFQGTYKLAGASDCTLYERRLRSGRPVGANYQCSLSMDAAAAEKEYARFAGEFRGCDEVKDWTFSEVKLGPGFSALTITNPKTGPHVVMNLVPYAHTNNSYVQIGIVNPNPA